MNIINTVIMAGAGILSFAIALLLGKWLIPWLHKLKFGQTILEDGPTWHQKKQGTPTMGGIFFIVGFVVSVVAAVVALYTIDAPIIYEFKDPKLQNVVLPSLLSTTDELVRFWGGFGLALGCGLIGFADDYIKVVKKRNLGLTAKQKTIFQLLLSASYLWSMYLGGMTYTRLPFLGKVDITSGWGLLFWPIALIFIYGFTNAVNLTDGVDGLATSVTAVVAGAFVLLFSIRPLWYSEYCVYITVSAAFLGGCIGFLLWNRHPAKVFMGDTGSMFLGGMVVALSFMIEMPFLLIFAGILYFIEAMSVTIQVAYYKRTKKRLFKMSPIHHHFELSGWSENKIVYVFSFISLIGCIIAVLLYLYT